MFEGFNEFDLEVAETTIQGAYGGSGPPLLLLRSIPETHLMWHRVVHFVPPGSGVLDRADWLLAIVPALLDASLPEVAE